MNVVRFDPRRKVPPPPGRDVITPMLAMVALIAVSVLGWVAVDRFMPAATGPATTNSQADDGGRRESFSMCGRDRFTCVVDGDTIWLDGMNLRLQSYDTPEPYTGMCGGDHEVALAKRASSRLLDLLNSSAFRVDTFGLDNTGERTLATVRVGGRDVGDILIEEGLARRWPDGDEFWC